jgi:hypothetical protein
MLSPRTKLSARDFSKLIVLILRSSFSSARIVVKATTVPFPVLGKFLKDPYLKIEFFTEIGKKYVAQIFSNNLNVISGQNLILADLKRFNPAWRNFSDPARKILSSQSGRVFLWGAQIETCGNDDLPITDYFTQQAAINEISASLKEANQVADFCPHH